MPDAKVVAFFSFGEALYGGPYYDTQTVENLLKAQCLLATRMNGQRLPKVYGAPLRLRVENQLERVHGRDIWSTLSRPPYVSSA
jgi:DMSO/TMAO reductase YedYZ molybdopterin-dependent catalytic subunit